MEECAFRERVTTDPFILTTGMAQPCPLMRLRRDRLTEIERILKTVGVRGERRETCEQDRECKNALHWSSGWTVA